MRLKKRAQHQLKLEEVSLNISCFLCNWVDCLLHFLLHCKRYPPVCPQLLCLKSTLLVHFCVVLNTYTFWCILGRGVA